VKSCFLAVSRKASHNTKDETIFKFYPGVVASTMLIGTPGRIKTIAPDPLWLTVKKGANGIKIVNTPFPEIGMSDLSGMFSSRTPGDIYLQRLNE